MRDQGLRAAGPASYDDPAAARALGLAALGLAGGLALAQARLGLRRAPVERAPRRLLGRLRGREPQSAEVRGLHGAAALLGLSVLADSALEHYRGSFENPGMYTPLITSALTVLAGAEGAGSGSDRRRRPRTGLYATAVGVGAIGSGFHLYNILRRPGGFNWLNLFYSAPIGAPAALSLAGLLGLAADRLRQPLGRGATLLGLPAGRLLAALTGLGIAGTVGEAGVLHFRGSFQNPFMFAPVTVPPVAAALMLKAAAGPRPERAPWATRAWLGLTATLGFAGVGFHAFGVSRAMGGWRNWTQNLIDGPPLPAPPSFSALSLAGLVALSLLGHGDE